MDKIKWILWLLVAAMVLSLFGGCAPTPEEELGVVDTIKPDSQTNERPKEPAGQTDPEQQPAQPEQNQSPAAKEEPSGEEEPSRPQQGDAPSREPTEDLPEEKEPEWVKMEKESSGTPITFLSQNVRHSGTRLLVKGDGVGNSIYNRMHRFQSLVKVHSPDVIFYSEARVGAISFMEQDPYFVNNYTLHYRYEGGVQAEPLLWKTDRFEAIKSGFFWLSDTPQFPSGYDGTETIVSWALLKVRQTGEKVYCASTHFRPGNKSDIVVPSMAQYHKIAQENEGDIYTFFGGDFNAHYRKEPYDMMMEWEQVVDLRDVAMYMYDDGLTQLGGMYTGTNINYDAASEDPTLMPQVATTGSQIDYVMMKPNPHVAVDYYGFDYTVYDNKEAGVKPGHISDHYGLVVKVRIQTAPDYSQYQREPYDYGDRPMYFETA